MTEETIHYSVKVIRYLEYLDYPAMAQEFEPFDVAMAMTHIINQCIGKVSHRKCALLIYGTTWLTIVETVTKDTKEIM